MQSLKFPSIALFALAILMASVHAARAETTTLVCENTEPSVTSDEPAMIELNEAQKKVTLKMPAMHPAGRWAVGVTGGTDGRGGTPSFTGTYAAEFESDTISFGGKSSFEYKINRLTGAFTIFDNGNDYRAVYGAWTCHPGKKQF